MKKITTTTILSLLSLGFLGAQEIQELDEQTLESIPLPLGAEDYAQPATRLSADELTFNLEASLGETLNNLPGVSSTNYFPGASRPIIRGFSNDRIRILANGIDGIDASVGSLDHALTVEPYLAERVEIIRGPAVLLYGSNAVGGVINVLDNRVPSVLPETDFYGRLHGTLESANRGGVTYGIFGGQQGNWAFQASGLFRNSGDLSIPGFGAVDPELQQEQESGRLENSFVRTLEASFGLSRMWDGGFAGGAISTFTARYGLGREVEQEVEGILPDGSLDIEAELDDAVEIDLEQIRLDLRGGLSPAIDFIESINWRFGAATYEHSELEDGEVGTTFKNDGFEFRTEFVHREIAGFDGAFGMQVNRSEFEATGDEAFLRPTTTNKFGLFLFEEIDIGDVLWQGGARLEYQSISTNLFERDAITGRDIAPNGFNKLGLSGALGAVWRPSDAHRFSINYSYTQRLPSAQELYADGPHIGTFAYELSDHVAGDTFSRETSHGIDLGYRWQTDRWRISSNVFYYTFNNFINLRRTSELAFENEDDSFTIIDRSLVTQEFLDARLSAGEENEFLDVTRYQRSGAEFYGLELEARYTLWSEGARTLNLNAMGDWVSAEDTDTGDPLPRIPPVSLGAGLDWNGLSSIAGVNVRRNFKQTRVSPNETETDGYTLVNLHAGYRWNLNERSDLILFGRLDNVFDTEARNHTSFVKDLAPLAGRNFRAGLELRF